MAETMLKFVYNGKAYPEKRLAEIRRADFEGIYQPLVRAKAEAQAARCSQCGVPFCQSACPLGNDIPDWLMLAAEGRLEEAFRSAAATNPMPEICGSICPQDRLCEGHCVIEQSGHGAVTIGAIEKFLTEEAFARGWAGPVPVGNWGIGERAPGIGIIGAGPAGLAAAEMLRRQGVDVTLYDRHDRAGGLMAYGIPNFKLEKSLVARRVARLEASGVQFRQNCDVGRDISFAELRARHDGVLITTGVYKARALDCGKDSVKSVLPALDFLIASQRARPGAADKRLSASGKSVLVVGGGDTAMDCVRTALRQDAREVVCLYRRDRAGMPGSPTEVRHAEEEGARFHFLLAPAAIEGDRRAGFRVIANRIRLLDADAMGRRMMAPVPGEFENFAADLVISALGFEPEDLPVLFNEPGLKTARDGRIRAGARDFATSLPGVFAAGDIVRGASLVVWALKDGKEAAGAITHFLRSAPETRRVVELAGA